MEYNEMTLVDVVNIKTGKLNSNAAVENGKFPFFTCAPEPLRIDKYKYDQAAILLAGNNAEGNFHINYFEGKFEAYQRTYIIDSRDSDRYDLKYIFYALKECLHEFKLMSQGTSTKFLTIAILNGFKLKIPSIEVQRKISGILSGIDDKIKTNTAINRNLLEQAQTLFNELFDVSEGIDGTLSDVGTIVAGGTPSKAKTEYFSEKGIAWITPKDLSVDKSVFIYHGENDISDLGYRKSSATKMPAGTVLFSSRAPIGYIAIAGNEVTTNQGFKSVVPKEGIGTAYVYFLLKKLLPTIENMASGSTFKEISGSAMKRVPITLPDKNSLMQFNEFCEPLLEQIQKLEMEIKRLAILRDTLLPKLMSGELDVSDIDI